MSAPLKVMLVDDEAPARSRLRHLLDDIAGDLATDIVAEAVDGIEALQKMAEHPVDVAVVDIRMPRMDGLQLALQLSRLREAPAVIFVTAFDQYAVNAFELSAIDYLLKPVRAPRLLDALRKVRRGVPNKDALRGLVPQGRSHLRATERGRVVLIPVDAVIYLRAEQKYVTVRTADAEHLIEDTLSQLESEFDDRFVRAHRNCLVARQALSGYERGADAEADAEVRWHLILRNIDERIPVSRRQWPMIKQLLRN